MEHNIALSNICPLRYLGYEGEESIVDLFDQAFREPTADEVTCRRVLSLAIALTNSHRPRTTSELRHEYYQGLTDGAFKKAFKRDRDRLASAGITIRAVEGAGTESAWAIDEDASFAPEGAISPDDALALDFLFLPIASDPAFPYAADLRVALAKIDRAFDGTSTAVVPKEARDRNAFLNRIEDCLRRRCAIRIDYTKADGTEIQRTLAPYGLFYLNGHTYLVAARAGSDTDEGEPAHTYNVDRVTKLTEMTKIGYQIPIDFDVNDFAKLPFQLGKTKYIGVFSDDNKGITLEYEVADEEVAGAWAIAEGYRPLEPESLVASWRKRLERFSRGA